VGDLFVYYFHFKFPVLYFQIITFTITKTTVSQLCIVVKFSNNEIGSFLCPKRYLEEDEVWSKLFFPLLDPDDV
jgi:hypothetical protein